MASPIVFSQSAVYLRVVRPQNWYSRSYLVCYASVTYLAKLGMAESVSKTPDVYWMVYSFGNLFYASKSFDTS